MKHRTFFGGALIALLGVGVTAITLEGCARSDRADVTDATASAVDDQGVGMAATPIKGAAQLWAENCNRCHNSRSPSERSDAEWQVIMTHMRVQAYLTGEEQRQILKLLQSSN